MNELQGLIVFQGKNIRRIWHKNEWWFSVVDIIEALTDSNRPRKYWSDLKIKLNEEGFQLSEKIGQLKLQASDGKYYETDCANTKNMFRIIQSVPSPKAEPFKQWLAQVGYERVGEIENPELGQDRIKKYYQMKGYPQEWIDKRLRGIAIRQELTNEWKQRGVKEGKEFAILTNEISKATFGKTIEQHKEFKGLKRENLRDHMTELELIFSMLGEKVTTEIAHNKNTQGFYQNKKTAQQGGHVAGTARKNAEKKIGKSVVTGENYLKLSEKHKNKQLV